MALRVQSRPGLHSEFQDSQDDTGRHEKIKTKTRYTLSFQVLGSWLLSKSVST